MNKQNPDRGIETAALHWTLNAASRMNKQNPDRGIETATVLPVPVAAWTSMNKQNPDRGIETSSMESKAPVMP